MPSGTSGTYHVGSRWTTFDLLPLCTPLGCDSTLVNRKESRIQNPEVARQRFTRFVARPSYGFNCVDTKRGAFVSESGEILLDSVF
jgi:hypothetical protein